MLLVRSQSSFQARCRPRTGICRAGKSEAQFSLPDGAIDRQSPLCRRWWAHKLASIKLRLLRIKMTLRLAFLPCAAFVVYFPAH